MFEITCVRTHRVIAQTVRLQPEKGRKAINEIEEQLRQKGK